MLPPRKLLARRTFALQVRNVSRKAALTELLNCAVHAKQNTLAGDPAAPLNESGAAFTQRLIVELVGADELEPLLKDELPCADQSIADMSRQLKLGKLEKQDEVEELQALEDAYQHISTTRQAILTVVQNVAGLPADVDLDWMPNRFYLVSLLTNQLLREMGVNSSSYALIDPDEGGGTKAAVEREQRKLWKACKEVDGRRFLKEIVGNFNDSFFTKPQILRDKWEQKTKAATAEKEVAVKEKSNTEVAYPIEEKHTSFMAKALSAELWELLRTHPTVALLPTPNVPSPQKRSGQQCGFSLEHLIKPGLDEPDAKVGCVVGDVACYDRFAALLDLVVDKAHPRWPRAAGLASDSLTATTPQLRHHPMLARYPSPDELKLNIKLKHDPADGTRVRSVRVTATRNLAAVPLLPACTPEDLEAAEYALRKALDSLGQRSPDLKGICHSLASIDKSPELKALKAKLRGSGAYFEAAQKGSAPAAGKAAEWPAHRSLFVNTSHTLWARVNEGDHLMLTVHLPKFEPEKAYSTWCAAIRAISEHEAISQGRLPQESFAVHPRLGYVSFDPARLGSCFTASLLVRLEHNNSAFDATPATSSTDGAGAGAHGNLMYRRPALLSPGYNHMLLQARPLTASRPSSATPRPFAMSLGSSLWSSSFRGGSCVRRCSSVAPRRKVCRHYSTAPRSLSSEIVISRLPKRRRSPWRRRGARSARKWSVSSLRSSRQHSLCCHRHCGRAVASAFSASSSSRCCASRAQIRRRRTCTAVRRGPRQRLATSYAPLTPRWPNAHLTSAVIV